MAIKTALDLKAMVEILAPFDLRPRKLRRLEAGTINSNFKVDTDGGPVVVRVNEGKSEPDVRYEGALLWHLGVRHFPTPQPLRRVGSAPYVRHDGKLITVFPWVTGDHVGEGALTPEHTGLVGATLAALHLGARDFAEERDGIYTFAHMVHRVETLRGEPRVAEVLPELDAEIAYLEMARAPHLPSGTIHGDLFPDNVLWRRGELAAVLDFEQASVGRYAYDLAVTLLAWCWRPASRAGGDVDDARAHALLSAYQRARPLEPIEREAFLGECRAAAFRFTVTRLTDVFLPSLPGAEVEGKDYRDYLARLTCLRALAAESETGAARVRSWLSVSNGAPSRG